MNEHRCTAQNAKLIWTWLLTRGGILLWKSIDLSDLGKMWTTPAINEEGKPYIRPIWKADSTPDRHITDVAQVLVDEIKEVKRFRVAVRLGSQGLSYKVSDGGSRKIRAETAKANQKYQTDQAWHDFDYDTQEAVIFVPSRTLPIQDYILETLGEFP